MYTNPSSYKLSLTDRESSLIRTNFECYIRNKGWSDFFRAAYAGTEMIDLLAIIRKTTDCEIVTLDRYELRMIVDVISTVDNAMGARDELIKLKDDIDNLIYADPGY